MHAVRAFRRDSLKDSTQNGGLGVPAKTLISRKVSKKTKIIHKKIKTSASHSFFFFCLFSPRPNGTYFPSDGDKEMHPTVRPPLDAQKQFKAVA